MGASSGQDRTPRRRGDGLYRALEDAVATLFRAIEEVPGAVVGLVPLAIFAVVARTVGAGDARQFKLLGAYVVVAVLGLAIQVQVV